MSERAAAGDNYGELLTIIESYCFSNFGLKAVCARSFLVVAVHQTVKTAHSVLTVIENIGNYVKIFEMGNYYKYTYWKLLGNMRNF